MKSFIRKTLIELHKTCTTDKYGQVSKHHFTPNIFGDKKDDVQKYCKEHKGILQFSTYGGSYGTYTAFTIEDAELRKLCAETLKKNKNYIENVNSWL